MAKIFKIDKKNILDEDGEDYRIELTPQYEIDDDNWIKIEVYNPIFDEEPMYLEMNIEDVELLRDFLNELIEYKIQPIKKGDNNGKTE